MHPAVPPWDTARVTAPEQFSPPVYACTAGAVLHAHAGDTLEPGILLYTFLPPGAADALRSAEPRVDVHSDGVGAATVTVRVLADDTSLTWQLPLSPFVAALPGQSGDEGRMVLLAVVDAEPGAAFWAEPVDCARLTGELQLPVAELVEALRGRLTPWLDDDLQLLMHDDAHDRAADRSPAQTLAEAVLAQYRGDLAAEQSISRVLRALTMAPADYSVELGARLSAALVAALEAVPPAATEAVLTAADPFETEVLRLLGDLPGLLAAVGPAGRTEVAMEFLLEGQDRDDTVRGALSVITRLARSAWGEGEPDERVLQQLGMVDDAGLLRLAGLWVALGVATSAAPERDAATARQIAERVEAEGRPGHQWLAATAGLLVGLADDAGRAADRIAPALEVVRLLAAGGGESVAGIEAALTVARFLRLRRRLGPGDWLQGPAPAAGAATLRAYAGGLDPDVTVDLLSELLDRDVQPVDLLDGFICATAQVLAQLDPTADPVLRQVQVSDLLSSVPAGPRGARWLMSTCLREAHDHDGAAPDLSALLPREPAVDPDRAADKAGLAGMLRAGLSCADALAATLGEEAEIAREELLTYVVPTALVEHEIFRQSL